MDGVKGRKMDGLLASWVREERMENGVGREQGRNRESA